MFRNKEILRFAVYFILVAAAAVISGFLLNPAAGWLALVLSAALAAVFFIFTAARYRNIARLSEQIDMVLHNADRIYMEDCDEGELSILQSEIAKMTLRIREQNLALQREKEHLADSLADIAHQLRTPLTSANLILSLLENNPDETERQQLLRETEELFTRMDWLLTSLLKISRLDAGIVEFHNEQVAVEQIIDAALRPLLIPLELHNIAVNRDIPQGTEIFGDCGWLAEAFQNIIKNCLENTEDGGSIAIACEDNPIYTEITIRDSGRGFAEDDLPHIFDRFYRGKNSAAAASATGYGIGLAMCRMIITRQGGNISAKNHPEGGALFAIRFPK